MKCEHFVLESFPLFTRERVRKAPRASPKVPSLQLVKIRVLPSRLWPPRTRGKCSDLVLPPLPRFLFRSSCHHGACRVTGTAIAQLVRVFVPKPDDLNLIPWDSHGRPRGEGEPDPARCSWTSTYMLWFHEHTAQRAHTHTTVSE